MSTFRLDKLFCPRSVALVGGSPRENSTGRAVLRNLRGAGFEGTIALVNPHYAEIEGIKAVKNIQELQAPPDLLVIVAPAHRRARHRRRCRRKGNGDRNHRHRRARAWNRLARRRLRKGGPGDRPQARRPKLSRHPGSARKAQCQFRSAHAARRRSCPGVAVGSHYGRLDRMVGSARHWFLRRRLIGRQG